MCVCVCVCVCMCLGGGASNGAISKSRKEEMLFKMEKYSCQEAFQDLLKSCLSFGGGLEGPNEEKMGRKQKKEVLNVGKHRLGDCENPVGISLCMTVLWELPL